MIQLLNRDIFHVDVFTPKFSFQPDENDVDGPGQASLPYPVPGKIYKCTRADDDKVKIARVLGVQPHNGEKVAMVRYVDDTLEIVPTAAVKKADPEVR